MLIQCRKCGTANPIEGVELLVAVEEFLQTVEGRNAIRELLRKHDRRVGADKAGRARPNPTPTATSSTTLTRSPSVRLGALLAQRRQAKNMTQAALAQQLGINRFTLLRYERGHAFPSLAFFDRWAALLSTTLRDLFLDTER